MNDDTGGRCRLRRMWSLRTGFLAIVAGTALLTAACSGGATSSPQVASLGSSNGTGSGSPSGGTGSGNSTTSGSTGNPAQLVDEWAACMRGHGDPSQADPTIDANKVIHIVMLPSVPGGVSGSNGQSSSGPGTHCATYLTAASAALRGAQPAQKAPSQAQLVKYAECMRANGVPDFPDPAAGGLSLKGQAGSDLNPDNPALQNAAKVCVQKTGVDPVGGGGPLPPGSIVSGPPGGSGMPLVPVSGGGAGANG
jgi:hypothetical protein